MKTEMAIRSSLQGVENFDTAKLKNVDVQEKNPLPDKEGKNFILFYKFSIHSFSRIPKDCCKNMSMLCLSLRMMDRSQMDTKTVIKGC